MARRNEARQDIPVYPDPRNRDQNMINRQLIDVIKYLHQRLDDLNAEKRIGDLEDRSQDHEDVING